MADQLVDNSQVITGWCKSDDSSCPPGCQPIPEYPAGTPSCISCSPDITAYGTVFSLTKASGTVGTDKYFVQNGGTFFNVKVLDKDLNVIWSYANTLGDNGPGSRYSWDQAVLHDDKVYQISSTDNPARMRIWDINNADSSQWVTVDLDDRIDAIISKSRIRCHGDMMYISPTHGGRGSVDGVLHNMVVAIDIPSFIEGSVVPFRYAYLGYRAQSSVTDGLYVGGYMYVACSYYTTFYGVPYEGPLRRYDQNGDHVDIFRPQEAEDLNIHQWCERLYDLGIIDGVGLFATTCANSQEYYGGNGLVCLFKYDGTLVKVITSSVSDFGSSISSYGNNIYIGAYNASNDWASGAGRLFIHDRDGEYVNEYKQCFDSTQSNQYKYVSFIAEKDRLLQISLGSGGSTWSSVCETGYLNKG